MPPDFRKKKGERRSSPATAYGVFCGMRAALEERFGDGSFREEDRDSRNRKGRICLGASSSQGGAKLYVCDMDPERVAAICKVTGADPLLGHEIYRVECDIFSPCALGDS